MSVSYDIITSIELERGVFSSKIIIRVPGFADVMESISKKVAEQIVEHVKNSMEKIKTESQKNNCLKLKNR